MKDLLNERVKVVYNDQDKEGKNKAILGILTSIDDDFLRILQDNQVECILSKKSIILLKGLENVQKY